MSTLSPSRAMAGIGLMDSRIPGGMAGRGAVEIPPMPGGGSMEVEAPPWFGTPESAEMRNALATGVGGMGVPILSDVAGFYADADMLWRKPEERTAFNYSMAGLGLLPFVPGMTVWHGSPHLFDKFRIDKIGTGEGAQVYGKGLYFAELQDTARRYWNQLAPRTLRTKTGEPYHVPWDDAPDSIRSNAEYYEDVFESPAKMQEEILNARQLARTAEQTRMPGIAKEATERANWLDRVSGEFVPSKGGALYEVDLPDEHIDKMLDWNAPLSGRLNQKQADWLLKDALGSAEAVELRTYAPSQSKVIDELISDETLNVFSQNEVFNDPRFRQLVRAVRNNPDAGLTDDLVSVDNQVWELLHSARGYMDDVALGSVTGEDAARYLHSQYGPDEAARIMSEDWGLPGIKYLDQGSVQGYSQAEEPTRNFVVFDEDLVEILQRHTDQ